MQQIWKYIIIWNIKKYIVIDNLIISINSIIYRTICMPKSYLTPKEEILVFLKTIPRGKVTTYRALSKKFGCHPRIIISIMKGNKQPDTTPCYKVLPNDGSLDGYILGIPERVKRLEKDGIGIKNGKVEEKFIIFELK